MFIEQDENKRMNQQVENIFRTTDLYIDHMRVCEWEEESQHASLRVMVDGEPAFCQIQMEQKEKRGEIIGLSGR